MKKQLILASSSEPRRKLLERFQIPFDCVSPDVDETPLAGEHPKDLVLRLAEMKAKTVAKPFSNALIIGADQVGVLDGEILGKPLTHENASKQLQASSGNTLRFFIGVCVLETSTGNSDIFLETYDVVYRQLSLQQIEHYLEKEEPLQCAGSCKAEGLGIALIEAFHGKDFTALIGLPLTRLAPILEKFGLDPLLKLQ